MAAGFDSLSYTDRNAFSDVADSHWAVSYINSAYAKGWIGGYTDGTFRPQNSITRAEVVTIVNAMLDRAIDDAALTQIVNPYSDISSSHWGHMQISWKHPWSIRIHVRTAKKFGNHGNKIRDREKYSLRN